jgi:hypothetical protein
MSLGGEVERCRFFSYPLHMINGEMTFGLTVVIASLVLMVILVILSFRGIEAIHRRGTAGGAAGHPQEGAGSRHGK